MQGVAAIAFYSRGFLSITEVLNMDIAADGLFGLPLGEEHRDESAKE